MTTTHTHPRPDAIDPYGGDLLFRRRLGGVATGYPVAWYQHRCARARGRGRAVAHQSHH